MKTQNAPHCQQAKAANMDVRERTDTHGHAKGEHRPYGEERPTAYSARMLFLWFYHACARGFPHYLMVSDHINFLTPADPDAVRQARAALEFAAGGEVEEAARLASVSVAQAQTVYEGMERGMRFSIGAEVDNDPRSRPDAPMILDAMRPDGLIRSIHFLDIEDPVDGSRFQWPFDNPEFSALHESLGAEKTWRLYMAELLAAMETQGGQIVGHFYVPAIFGSWSARDTLEEYEDRFVDACARTGMAIEFNLRFLYRDHPRDQKERYLAAHERLLTKAVAENVGVAVGSDAHTAGDQGRALESITQVLDRAGVTELVFPVEGKLTKISRLS